MAISVSQPNLRLVRAPSSPGYAEWEQRQHSRNAVVKENRLAAHGSLLNPDDPVLKLAVETRSELQGAVLTPERREKLLKLANRIGVRPFDASLVIAIEQDRARREPCVIPDQASQVRVTNPSTGESWSPPMHLLRWVLAVFASLAAAILLIRWLELA